MKPQQIKEIQKLIKNEEFSIIVDKDIILALNSKDSHFALQIYSMSKKILNHLSKTYKQKYSHFYISDLIECIYPTINSKYIRKKIVKAIKDNPILFRGISKDEIVYFNGISKIIDKQERNLLNAKVYKFKKTTLPEFRQIIIKVLAQANYVFDPSQYIDKHFLPFGRSIDTISNQSNLSHSLVAKTVSKLPHIQRYQILQSSLTKEAAMQYKLSYSHNNDDLSAFTHKHGHYYCVSKRLSSFYFDTSEGRASMKNPLHVKPLRSNQDRSHKSRTQTFIVPTYSKHSVGFFNESYSNVSNDIKTLSVSYIKKRSRLILIRSNISNLDQLDTTRKTKEAKKIDKTNKIGTKQINNTINTIKTQLNTTHYKP